MYVVATISANPTSSKDISFYSNDCGNQKLENVEVGSKVEFSCGPAFPITDSIHGLENGKKPTDDLVSSRTCETIENESNNSDIRIGDNSSVFETRTETGSFEERDFYKIAGESSRNHVAYNLPRVEFVRPAQMNSRLNKLVEDCDAPKSKTKKKQRQHEKLPKKELCRPKQKISSESERLIRRVERGIARMKKRVAKLHKLMDREIELGRKLLDRPDVFRIIPKKKNAGRKRNRFGKYPRTTPKN